ncbi:MAG: prepilin peptidase [Actinomycetota bacterium]
MFVETNPIFLIALFLGGLMSGGLGVKVVHRDRARVPLLKGRFVCPQCAAPYAFVHRLPLISYLVGRGRRPGCGCRTRVRDPLLELFTGLAWVAVGARLGLSTILPAFLAYATTLAILSAVDLDERRIPNKVLGPMAVVGAVLLAAAAMVTGRPGVLLVMAVGAVGYALPMLLLAIVAPGSMGMGDIKLAGYIGMHLAWFGLEHVLIGALLAFIIGAAVGLLLIALRKKGRKDTVPFGPSMALGGLLPLFLGTGAGARIMSV